MFSLFVKIWLKSIFYNIIIWGIGFSILEPLVDFILGNPLQPLTSYIIDGVTTGFLFSFFETSITFFLVKRILQKYHLRAIDFEFGKPYQKSKPIYTDMSKVLQKIEQWNKNSFQKFIIKKIEPNSLEIWKGANIIHLIINYGELVIRSEHRFKFFYIEQGQNIENVELLFLLIQSS